ncbi:MAG: hypothetical protein COV29_03130 [Candidatus Yanofskybacteria bacterium CG10_big_fil_rev_8_21_14_0_10_36_16]|uniref:GH10 domain-containing protein n=1 Tax=Candidatus Yanofskybacteria bacterium CG10_big_fil_rev_8_21_14_0_10_36_16 TaxID=1975096 RepID=A0A2J0Q784_9BACT|nr:MAG: hypothetical protein COV29_03130 [Candidatus Yanofskybacteria bacterium CG10_big_fil_rev_8_21_14_0_10_36_16]
MFHQIFKHKLLSLIIVLFFALILLSLSHIPDKSELKYGVSFSKFHSDELGLDWKETYLAILDDLGVKRLRLSAHWPMVEPKMGEYNFEELDYQIAEAEKRDVEVIFAVGRRLPGWPECHDPDWAKELSQEEKNNRILSYIKETVSRYKDSSAIKIWQVENEPFLGFFGRSHCGEFDDDFLDKEINLVKQLDTTRPVLITDSGEFGKWWQAHNEGDHFGTSMYLYVWWRNKYIGGPIRYPITPAFFRIKHNFIKLFNEDKPAMVIELSAEPWLLQPIVETPLDVQLDRMGIDKFNEIIEFSNRTGFNTFYLWGAEWWYYLKKHENYPEHWARAQELFR